MNKIYRYPLSSSAHQVISHSASLCHLYSICIAKDACQNNFALLDMAALLLQMINSVRISKKE